MAVRAALTRPSIRAVAAVAAAIVVAGGCVSVDGGAVEVPWAIFAPDGRAITDCGCADPPIVQMRIGLVSDVDATLRPCDQLASCTFSCGQKIGATPFVIPPGRYLMTLSPIDESGTEIPPEVIRRTPALVRDVVRGQPTELEAFFFEAPCSTACRGGTATEPCTR